MRMWRLPVGLAVLWLAACGKDVLPAGVEPSALYLDAGSGSTKSFSVSECTASQVNAVLLFSGESAQVGNFTSRVQWHSSSPETLYVSDGVTPYSDGLIYAAGALLAIRPGSAQITATYLSFTASATVEVRELNSLRIEPELTDLAENLQQQFNLYVRYAEGQAEQLATTNAQWSFPRTTALAAVGTGTGLVTTNSAGADTVELSAQLAGCTRDVRTRFRVSTVQSLEVGYEQGSEPRLPVGYSEAVTVHARFAAADSTLQNVASFVDVDGLDDDLLGIVAGTEALYVQALDTSASAAATGFTMTLDSTNLTVQSKLWTPVDTDLLSLKISPSDVRMQFPDTPVLQALGTFADGVQRPISRHVTWASSATSLVVGSGVSDAAGKLSSEDLDATVEVSATQAAVTEDTTDSILVRTYASTSTVPQ